MRVVEERRVGEAADERREKRGGGEEEKELGEGGVGWSGFLDGRGGEESGGDGGGWEAREGEEGLRRRWMGSAFSFFF